MVIMVKMTFFYLLSAKKSKRERHDDISLMDRYSLKGTVQLKPVWLFSSAEHRRSIEECFEDLDWFCDETIEVNGGDFWLQTFSKISLVSK